MKWSTSLGTVALWFAAAGAALAADKDRPDKADVNVSVGERGVNIEVGDRQFPAHMFQGTNFLGMNVKNKQGENLGTIHDLVFDFECRQVRYAAISFGGLLGVGDKLFAVPLSALTLRYDSSGLDPHILFEVTKERLSEMPGFDQNHWPDMADAGWSREIDKFYGVTFDDAKLGVEVKGEKTNPQRAKPSGRHHGHHALRATVLNGMAVQNNTNEALGTISDFVLNAQTGLISHFVITHGAVAGLGGEQYIVPAAKFTLKDNVTDDKRMLVLPISLQHFKDAPRIGEQWPNLNEKDWSNRFDRYYDKHSGKSA